MKESRCPYHVKQGLVDSEGKLILSDVCGVKSACGSVCPHAPFKDNSHKECSRYVTHVRGAERQVLVPKNDIEYLPEVSGLSNFSEIDLL
ncbi:hypothetical protein ACWNT8_11040 [Pigmentibacter ruber]|uniref:hypothetical protein n=1 Tax=Pigmentibacter TaxID=2838409 RepID=UPI00131D259E|nr:MULTISPECIES: hypothetical protein [Pigmentibacter]WGL59894.1 hypothetical protein QEJ31_15285 [Pigmentibacter sp. JX0631]BFD32161.1 hypothetical protein GTC16762_17790 [Pigmentibacter ruber]